MTAEEILQSLEQLESNLQNIESARVQVETTVKAFAEVQKTFKNVGDNIVEFNKTLTALTANVKTNHATLSSDAKKILNETIELQKEAAKKFADSTQALADELSKACVAATSALQEKSESSVEQLNNIIKSLKADCDSIVTTLRSNVDSFVSQMAVYQQKQDKFTSEINALIKSLQDTQSSNFTNVISLLNSVCESLTNQSTALANLDKQICSVKAELLHKSTDDKNEIVGLIKTVQSESNKLITQKTESLSNELSSIKTEVTNTKKEIKNTKIFAIIAVLLNVILMALVILM